MHPLKEETSLIPYFYKKQCSTKQASTIWTFFREIYMRNFISIKITGMYLFYFIEQSKIGPNSSNCKKPK